MTLISNESVKPEIEAALNKIIEDLHATPEITETSKQELMALIVTHSPTIGGLPIVLLGELAQPFLDGDDPLALARRKVNGEFGDRLRNEGIEAMRVTAYVFGSPDELAQLAAMLYIV